MVALEMIVAFAGALVISASVLAMLNVLRFSKTSPHTSEEDDAAASTTTTVMVPPKCAPWAPYWLPWIKHTFQLYWRLDEMHDWTAELCAQYEGKPFRIGSIGRPNFTFVSTPELFEDVLKTQFDNFEKGEVMNEALRDVLGRGIFAADGHEWLHQRKTGSNLFTARQLRDSMSHTIGELLPALHRVIDGAAARGETLDLKTVLHKFTLDAFTRIGFGCEFGCLETDQEHPFEAAFDHAQRILSLRLLTPPVYWKTLRFLNLGMERELREHIQVIDRTIFDIISRSLDAHKRQCSDTTASAAASVSPSYSSSSGAASKNLVSLFIDANADASHAVDAGSLRDVVVNFLVAGRDTSAQALSWLFVELTRHPHIETRIRDELRMKLPRLFTSSDCIAPTAEELQRLPYLEAAIKETLRLHPSVPMNSRRAVHDTVLSDGTFVPAGEFVAVPSYAIGRMTHVWGPDACAFRPERWLDLKAPTGLITVSAFKFSAFHAGPRTCLGMHLAMLQMKMLVASVLSKFHLRVQAPDRVKYAIGLTQPLREGLPARVDRL
ncbi:hypothetical protein PINS_up014515 [Pythium insidiosum]|nr:hypothetical protein PINS_up014515 [Pythium insidiosum]